MVSLEKFPLGLAFQTLQIFFSSSAIDLGIDLSVVTGGTAIHFHAGRFGSVHILPFSPFVGGISYSLSGNKTNAHSHRGDPRHVNHGGITYIPSYATSSVALVLSNVFLMTHPPHNLHGPSG